MTPIRCLATAAAIASLALVACSIEKEEEGDLPDVDVSADAGRLPDYEVSKVREGEAPDVDVDVRGGMLPDYDIDAPDVEVGTRTESVTVPKVKVVVEEEEIQVPYIDLDPADDATERDDRIGATAAADPNARTTGATTGTTSGTTSAGVAPDARDQTLTVVLDVPDEQYDVEIQEIYQVDEKLLVISRLETSAAATPGSTRSGKRASDSVVVRAPQALEVKHYIIGQRVEGNPDYRFIASKSEIESELRAARRVYQADPSTAQQLSKASQ